MPDAYAEVYGEVTPEPVQEHSRSGDIWARHASGDKRDRAADREVRQAVKAEQHGEYGPDGWQPSTWT